MRSTSARAAKIILEVCSRKQDPNVIPVMCCDTVNRGVAYGDGKIFLHQADTTLVALDAKTGKEVWKVAERRSDQGRDRHLGADGHQGQGPRSAISGGEFGVLGRVTAYNIKDGKHGLAGEFAWVRTTDMLIDPAKTTALGKPVGKDSGMKTWEGDQWKIGGGTHLGLDVL